MPFSYRVWPDLNLVFVRHWGQSSLREWLASADELGNDPGNTQRTNILADFRDIEVLDFDDEARTQLASLISGLARLNDEGKDCAFWIHSAAGAEFAQRLVKACETVPNIRFRAFTDRDDALRFLGVDPDHHGDRIAGADTDEYS